MFFVKNDVTLPGAVLHLVAEVVLSCHRSAIGDGKQIALWEGTNWWVLSWTTRSLNERDTAVTRQVIVTLQGRLHPRNGFLVEFATEVMVCKEGIARVLTSQKRKQLVSDAWVDLPITGMASVRRELCEKLGLACSKAWAMWHSDAEQQFW